MEVRRRISMEKGAMGGLTSIWKDRGANAGDEGETSERFGVPDSTIWSGDLDSEKTREKEDRCFRVVLLRKGY